MKFTSHIRRINILIVRMIQSLKFHAIQKINVSSELMVFIKPKDFDGAPKEHTSRQGIRLGGRLRTRCLGKVHWVAWALNAYFYEYINIHFRIRF